MEGRAGAVLKTCTDPEGGLRSSKKPAASMRVTGGKVREGDPREA